MCILGSSRIKGSDDGEEEGGTSSLKNRQFVE